MQAALRPYVTGGVALVGASMIAVAPVAAPTVSLTDIPQRAVQLTADATDPITSWIDVFATSFNNVSQTAQQVLADPLPGLTQFLTNGLGYGEEIVKSLSGAANGVAEFVTGDTAFDLGPLVQQLFGDLTSGDVTGAASTFNNILEGFILGPGIQLLPILQIPGQITDNLNNMVHALSTPLLLAAIGILSPLLGSVTALGDSGQAVVDAIGAGEPLAALGALVNIPANVTGALLNGYTGGFIGLLSPESGGFLHTFLVDIPQAIATGLAQSGEPGVTSLADIFAGGLEFGAVSDFATEFGSALSGLFGDVSLPGVDIVPQIIADLVSAF